MKPPGRLRAAQRTGVAWIAMALVAWLAGAAAWAGYREEPPKGVTLAGTTWQLDPYRSDEPQLALRKARAEIEAQRRKAMSERRRGPRGMGRGGGFPGGGFPGGGGGGRGAGRGDRDAGPPADGDDPYDDGTNGSDAPDGGAGGTAGPDGTGGPGGTAAPGDDPRGAGGTHGPGGRGPRGGPPGAALLDELAHHPERLALTGTRRTLRVQSDGGGIECEAGNDTMLQDRFGYGSRRCGWDGRAWVVETRHDDGSKRIDRYEASPDGQALTYSTSLDMKGVSKIVVTRTYVPATTPATPVKPRD